MGDLSEAGPGPLEALVHGFADIVIGDGDGPHRAEGAIADPEPEDRQTKQPDRNRRDSLHQADPARLMTTKVRSSASGAKDSARSRIAS